MMIDPVLKQQAQKSPPNQSHGFQASLIFGSNWSSTLRSLLILYLFVLGISWPKHAISYFFLEHTPPICFYAFSMVLCLASSYVSMRMGSKEEDHTTSYYASGTDRLMAGSASFTFKNLILPVCSTLSVVLLGLPFYLVAATASAISLDEMLICFLLIYLIASLFRLIGFTVLHIFQRFPILIFHTSRLLFLVFFFIPIGWGVKLSPLFAIYELYRGRGDLENTLLLTSLFRYSLSALSLILILIIINVMIGQMKGEQS